ncbi:MAG: hypothetical protein IKN56_02155 [Clostridia bacterium]|nr:hypothetical protein [Clostridia bacterium]MBR4450733.1 hypothetical protein [Clostridia bacterium]
MKKIVSLILALAMVFGFAVQSFAFVIPEFYTDYAQAKECLSGGDFNGFSENSVRMIIHFGDWLGERMEMRFNNFMRFIQTGDIGELFGDLKQTDAL